MLLKIICVILCIVIPCGLFSGCGSGTSEADESHTLKVGYGRVDISPEYPILLGGLNNERLSENVRDPIYATCIAYTDETDTTLLVFYLNLLNPFGPALLGKAAVSKATGVPVEQIFVSTDHNHSAPDISADDNPSVAEYNKSLKQHMIDAAKQAMEDRKDVTEMSFSKTYPQGFCFCRHYVLSNGSIAGDNFGSVKGNTYQKHVVPADNELQLVNFKRSGGKDVLLVNFQGHPTGHSEYPNDVISYTDVFRRRAEQELDCLFAYSLGASGNINSTSNILSENHYNGYEEEGTALGDAIVEAAKNSLEPAKIGPVRFIRQNIEAKQKSGNSTMEIPVSVFSVGDLAFVNAPYEMFSENGQTIKESSPYKITFISTVTDGKLSYIPSSATFDYPVEAFEVTMTKFEQGTAEKLQDEYIKLLGKLYKGEE